MQDPGVILQRTFDSFTAKMAAREDFELPARQFITLGEPVYDEPQFAVHTVSGPYQGMPGQPVPAYDTATGGVVLLYQNFGATIVRNWPISDNRGAPPSPEQYQAATLQCAHDALVLQQTFEQSATDNSIQGECDIIYWSDIAWVGPAGATIGTRLTFIVQL